MEKQQNMRLGFNCKEYSPLQFPTVSYNKVRQLFGFSGSLAFGLSRPTFSFFHFSVFDEIGGRIEGWRNGSMAD